MYKLRGTFRRSSRGSGPISASPGMGAAFVARPRVAPGRRRCGSPKLPPGGWGWWKSLGVVGGWYGPLGDRFRLPHKLVRRLAPRHKLGVLGLRVAHALVDQSLDDDRRVDRVLGSEVDKAWLHAQAIDGMCDRRPPRGGRMNRLVPEPIQPTKLPAKSVEPKAGEGERALQGLEDFRISTLGLDPRPGRVFYNRREERVHGEC
jgi:hypothetical protein